MERVRKKIQPDIIDVFGKLLGGCVTKTSPVLGSGTECWRYAEADLHIFTSDFAKSFPCDAYTFNQRGQYFRIISVDDIRSVRYVRFFSDLHRVKYLGMLLDTSANELKISGDIP
jgi:hypothetical protein